MELFEIKLINLEDYMELLMRFLLNFVVVYVAVRYIYYPIRRRRDYLFTYILISTVIFLLCFLLENVKLELGFALGLFAIFGIIRYRTQQIQIKEMTYLFLVIGISVINALANKKVSYAEIITTNVLLLLVTWGLERMMFLKHESTKSVNYEKIELIKPENHQLLIKDLEERTGIKINRVEIGKINFLRDTARVNIYYYEHENLADDMNTTEDDGD